MVGKSLSILQYCISKFLSIEKNQNRIYHTVYVEGERHSGAILNNVSIDERLFTYQ